MTEYIRWFNKQGFFAMFLLFTATLLLLSPIGSNELLVIRGFFIPELGLLLIAPLAIFGYKLPRIFLRYSINTSRRLLMVFAILLLFIIGTINSGDIVRSYSVTRAFVSFILGIYLVNFLYRYFDKKHAQFAVMTLVFFALFSALIYFSFISSGPKSAYSLPLILIFAYLTSLTRNFFLLFISITLISYMVITSGFRAYLLYGFIILCTLILTLISKSLVLNSRGLRARKDTLVILFLVILIPLLFQVSWPYIYNWIASDPSRYHQIIFKSSQLFSFLAGGEAGSSIATRMSSFNFMIENWQEFLFPRGFLDFVNNGVSVHRDSIFGYLVYTFGFIISFFIVIFIYWRLFFNVVRSNGDKGMRLAIIACLTVMFFTFGLVLTVIGQSFFFGMLISMQMINRREI
jgi:hypothetical protein